MANKASKKVQISKQYTSDEKTAISEDILEYIRDRSARGNGPGDRPWSGRGPKTKGGYTKEYMASIEFRIAGKNKKRVNQKLSGDMLVDMDVLGIRSDSIEYGYEAGSSEHGKAEGNIIGSYGKSSGNAKKARDFLKLTQTELRDILSNYPLRGKDASEKREKSTFARLSALDLIGDIIIGEE